MKFARDVLAMVLAIFIAAGPGLAAVGSWNGVAFTAWNGVAQTSWNGTAISCASGVTYAFTETFEGAQTDSQGETGYDNTGWTSSTNTNTPRYTTSPAPLAGTYSWLSATSGTLSRTITTTGVFYCYFMVNLTTATANELTMELRDSLNATIGAIRIRTTDTLRIEQVAVNSANATNGTLAASTTYHVWVDWAKGSGVNGIMAVYVATTATRPGAAAAAITTGTAVTDATTWRFTGPTVGIIDNAVFDYSTPIGSNPVP